MAYVYNPRDELAGDGLLDFIRAGVKKIGQANSFLKNTKIISRGARAVGNFTNSDATKRFADSAEQLGYGKVGDGRKGVKNAPKKNGRKGGKAKAKKK